MAIWTKPAKGKDDAGHQQSAHVPCEDRSLLLPQDTWQSILRHSSSACFGPSMSETQAWRDLLQQPWPQAHRQAVAQRVLEAAASPWPQLPARLMRRFARDGNRDQFQQAYFARRERITDIALLMAMDHNVDQVDDLVDGIWSVCEEASWCLPAHWHLASLPRRAVCDLPPESEQVDLFAAETAALLALCCHLCQEALDAWSSNLVPHIHQHIQRRCLGPVLTSDAWFWWDGHHNWSPWIAANLLTAGGITLYGTADDALLVHRLAGVLQRYLDHIPEDGYCDEGPSYWNAGTGMTVVALALLQQRSGGALDLLASDSIKAMGQYFADTYLGHGHWVINADSKPLVQAHPEVLMLLGQCCDIPQLLALGQELHYQQNHTPITPLMGGGGLGPRLRRLWWMDHQTLAHQSSTHTPSTPTYPSLDTWFASGEMALMRESPTAGDGCTAVIKFGHNRENHNHLDVGQVIVHWNEAPLIIDPGVDTYRSDHFSPNRYTITWINSDGHNPPRFDANGQMPGTGFGYTCHKDYAQHTLAACEVHFHSNKSSCTAQGDLRPCYPQVANLQQCQRTLSMQRSPSCTVCIEDDIHCDSATTYQSRWLSACKPHAVHKDGWRWDTAQGPIIAAVSGAKDISCHPIPLDDPQLKSGWGPQLWQITLTTPCNPRARVTIHFSKPTHKS
ncbi:MAG: hypothetical protein EA401_08315 [Planctomycetota bacterium]|nr:MAG: hypothetical protein EA401_08315 [Planctomycetota bacterium]